MSPLLPDAFRFVLVNATLAYVSLYGAAAVHGADRIEFNRDIRPILSENCFHCHGPDEQGREADLRLDMKPPEGSAVIVAGQSSLSELFRRVSTSDPDERMPPRDSERSLTPAQIEVLQRWIDQGADYESHWAFIPPHRPPLPKVADPEWCRNAVDHFVLARLESAGRRPSPEAARETLIRRVTFDLTGLPPTLAEIDAFLADASPTGYESLVDRLLQSSAYGERMTADWLDVARYSDTYGYQVDRDRFVWPWRDWVIRAFNNNMPYDEFITRQLAGDLLEGAGRDEILATTFNRLHPQKVEGGSVPEEFRIEYIADRTQTVATAFLGLTLECCRCHDHKYDPLSQRDYYQLAAFFDNIDEAGLYSYFTPAIPTPTLLLPTDEQAAQMATMHDRLSALEAEAEQLAASRHTAFESWLVDGRGTFEPPKPIAHLTFDDPPAAPNEAVDGKVGRAARLTGDDAINTEVGNFQRSQPFSVALWMNTPDVKERAVVFHRSRAWTDAGSRGYELLIEDGRLSWSLIHFWPGNAISIRTVAAIPTSEWVHVTVTYDGSSRADGLSILINGTATPTEVVRDNLQKQITGGGGDNIAIGERFRDRGFREGLVDEFRVYETQLTALEAAHLVDGEALTRTLQAPLSELTAAERSALEAVYRARVDSVLKGHEDALQQARTELNTTTDAVAEIMVMRELPWRKPSYFLQRGAYDAPGEQVVPQTPAAFAPLPAGATPDRLALAHWLTDRQHPLTARVAVNRLWQLCFGQGLVTTPEDFGSQGRPPTHPLLLDWLAVEFIEQDWDVKQLLRTLVTSATYRQASAVTSAIDPENALLGRGPTYRLPAEMLRDNALAVSGLLIDRQGGPPVKPYEVEESFAPSPRDAGEGLYRRSLYTYWKRTAPAPAMMTLDAAKRDVCRVNRERTASPLQSLVLLNGPQYIEAARALSERLVQQHGDQVDDLLSDLFRLLTGRLPSPEEAAIIQTLYEQQLGLFAADPAAAAAYLAVGDRPRDESLDAATVAAVSTVAGMLFNFDECVTKR